MCFKLGMSIAERDDDDDNNDDGDGDGGCGGYDVTRVLSSG
jgi:hypothetical protein